MIIIFLPQENDHIKCHQYYPPDDRPVDAPNFIQFDQVTHTECMNRTLVIYATYSIGLVVSLSMPVVSQPGV